jgi:hypothetical protein
MDNSLDRGAAIAGLRMLRIRLVVEDPHLPAWRKLKIIDQAPVIEQYQNDSCNLLIIKQFLTCGSGGTGRHTIEIPKLCVFSNFCGMNQVASKSATYG